MRENFHACLKHIRREEGGNSDHPKDPGGRTSRGIIQRVYNAWRQSKGLPTQDVFLATDAEVTSIYYEQYWSPYGDSLPTGLDLVFFDFCVNAGRQQSVKTLQRALGLPADGMFGVRTKTGVEQADIGRLIHAFSEKRRAFYRSLRTFSVFGKGWLARTDRIERAASQMAQTIPYASGAPTVSAKANPEDTAQPIVSAEQGATAATSSTVGVGIMDQMQDAVQHIAPLQDTVKIVKYILIAVAVFAFGATLYAIWKRRKVREAV